jgi:glycine cleavage system H protein
LLEAPEKLNQDPYGAWLVKLSGISDTGELISAADYEALCGEE